MWLAQYVSQIEVNPEYICKLKTEGLWFTFSTKILQNAIENGNKTKVPLEAIVYQAPFIFRLVPCSPLDSYRGFLCLEGYCNILRMLLPF